MFFDELVMRLSEKFDYDEDEVADKLARKFSENYDFNACEVISKDIDPLAYIHFLPSIIVNQMCLLSFENKQETRLIMVYTYIARIERNDYKLLEMDENFQERFAVNKNYVDPEEELDNEYGKVYFRL